MAVVVVVAAVQVVLAFLRVVGVLDVRVIAVLAAPLGLNTFEIEGESVC